MQLTGLSEEAAELAAGGFKRAESLFGVVIPAFLTFVSRRRRALAREGLVLRHLTVCPPTSFYDNDLHYGHSLSWD